MINSSDIYRPAMSIFILNIIIIYVYPDNSVITKFISIIYLIILLMLFNGNLIGFSFIPQAKVLLDLDSSIIYWFKCGHPHAVRLLVAYPGYILCKIYNIDLNSGFSYYVITIFNLMFLNMMDVKSKFNNTEHKYLMELLNFICTVSLTILAFIINGRLIFAYLGFLIIIKTFTLVYIKEVKINIEKIILLAIGFTLNAVSIGTLTVNLIYILSMLYIYYSKILEESPSKIKQFFLLIVLAAIIYIVIKYAIIMLFRNINYFGGGFKGEIAMLNHGIGSFFILSRFQTIVFVVSMVILLYMNYLFIKKQIQKKCRVLPLLLGINISLYGLFLDFLLV